MDVVGVVLDVLLLLSSGFLADTGCLDRFSGLGTPSSSARVTAKLIVYSTAVKIHHVSFQRKEINGDHEISHV